uniref:Large ribosomal subunit protein uL18c n=1 Tax=Polysiphonia scopulorum TaxID=257860 RepID=A0A1Z1MIJ8_9FLOR|nr:ribosomal protein L18 [Polysiphonia scopulorum]ARW65645.1 ribosomal protein L18 [Polysiphonia scopulorum]
MTLQKTKKPRLYIFKSKKHIYANLIDDEKNKVITSSSTLSQDIKSEIKSFSNCYTAAIVGKHIGSKINKLGIKKVVFDRGKKIYHGQIKALADATREQGIIF